MIDRTRTRDLNTHQNEAGEVHHRDVTRRRFLQLLAGGGAALVAGCAPEREATLNPTTAPAPPGGLATPTDPRSTPGRPVSYSLPTDAGAWAPSASHAGSLPSGPAPVQIRGVGEFTFEADEVETLRPDIFQPGHFSLFDALVRVAEQGDITLEYHFSEQMNTHVIDAINGEGGWWHSAYYSGGWGEPNVFRIDMYPYKNGTLFWLHKERDQRLTAIYDSFLQEVTRLENNGGRIIIPEVTIRSPSGNTLFRDVLVTPHDVRMDVLQPGVVTGLDAILSLAEQGELSNLKLTWYERIGRADPVDSYWLEQIDRAEATGSCGFVYETGVRGLGGNHIHIPSDVRVTVSPEYALWFWICL